MIEHLATAGGAAETRLAGSGSPTLPTLARLAASGGRSDFLRIALTAVGSAVGTLALLAAVSVMFIGPDDGPYRLEVLRQPGLRPGVIIAIVLLCVPLMSFVGQCSRIGAPARDRRLAMMRMAGATPSETMNVAAIETGLAALIGSLIGTCGFYLIRFMFDTTEAVRLTVETTVVGDDGFPYLTSADEVLSARWLATDVSVPPWALMLVVLLIPLAAGFGAVLALRKVTISPFGVIRDTIDRPPTAFPVLLFVGGTGGLIAWDLVSRVLGLGEEAGPLAVVALLLFLASAIGLLIGSASIAAAIGRFLAPRTGRPALLIASRRMITAPFRSSRASTSVLLAVLIGSAVQGVRANFLLGTDPADDFYANTFTLVNGVLAVAVVLAAASLLVTSAESIVERRRTLASLKASGVPTSELAISALLETVLPLIPAVLLASIAGILAARGLTGTKVEAFETSFGTTAPEAVSVPIPWDRLATLSGGTIIVCCAMTAISLLFLGRSTTPTELRSAA